MSPDRPVALRIPEQCRNCSAFAEVKLETTIKGETVILRVLRGKKSAP